MELTHPLMRSMKLSLKLLLRPGAGQHRWQREASLGMDAMRQDSWTGAALKGQTEAVRPRSKGLALGEQHGVGSGLGW